MIKQELDEASVTGNIDGGEGPPKTPYAFQGKRKKDKKKENKIATNSTGYSKVSEAKFHVRTVFGSVLVDAGGKGEAMMKVAKALKDDITKIKLSEAINQVENLTKGKVVKDKQVLTLMRYYELIKEIKNVHKS
jgi:hypothetical protein